MAMDAAAKSYWYGLLVAALLFFSVGYAARDWIPGEHDNETM